MQVAGAVKLEIGEDRGISLWIDGKKIRDLTVPVKLEKGRRSFTFRLRPGELRGVGLRVELKAGDDSVKFQPEGGI